MWYNIDFTKFALHLLPPILRSKVLMSLLKVMLTPLRYIYSLFKALKEGTDNTLNISGNVLYLQKAMNDAFFLKNDQIYIDTPDEGNKRVLNFRSENQPHISMNKKSEGKAQALWQRHESTVKYNFVVHVPSFLCTSIDMNEDKDRGMNIRIIMNILNKYKPAGRTFSIEIYDYE